MRTSRMGVLAELGVIGAVSVLAVACAGGDGQGEDSATVGQAMQGNGPPLCNGESRPKPLPNGVRRNVILMINDGAQLEDEIAISRYLFGTDFSLVRDGFPFQGFVTTWDVTTYNKYATYAGEALFDPANYDPILGYDPAQAGARPYPLENPPGLYAYLSLIQGPPPGYKWAATDSASSATAMSTGYKTDDGNIAWLAGDPPNGALPTVGEKVRAARGMSYGIVSTQAFTAATPGAFAGHNVNRNNFAAIGDDIIFNTQPDVVIGGGYPKMDDTPNWTYISASAYDLLSSPSSPYVLVQRAKSVEGGPALLAAADQAVAEQKKLFGLFGTAGSNGIFETGTPDDNPGHPHVTPGSLENPTLAQASVAALKVLSQNPNGFFLMLEQGDLDTGSHANNFSQMMACGVDMELAMNAVIDYVDQPGDDISWDNTVLMVVADHATGYMRLNPDEILGQGDMPTQIGTTYPDGEVSYATGGHQNELVHLSITGAMAGALSACEGREYPGTQILNNTVLHSFMLRAAGL